MNDNLIKEAEHEGLAMGRAFRMDRPRRRQPSRGHGRPLEQPAPTKRTVIRVLNKTLAEIMNELYT